MKNRKLLVSSFIMIISCCLLFAGTTFAWFSDSVTSNNNIITAGNLDVEMYWAEGTANPSDASWTDASTGAIFNYDKWEPGYALARHIKISNEGTLGLKYKINIVPYGEVSKLAEVIDVYYADPAIQLVDGSELTDSNKIGTLKDVLATLGSDDSTAAGSLNAGDSDVVTLVLKMQETAGNEYQGLSIGSSFAVQLLATQLNSNAELIPVVNNEEDLQVAVNAGGKVVLESNITLTEELALPEGKKVELDLNGKTLNAGLQQTKARSAEKHNYAFSNYGELVISNGTINARGIFNYGTIIVEDGAVINAIDGDGGYAVRNYPGAKLIMNGGSINTTLEDDHLVNNGGYDATTVRVDAGALFVMNGGTINNICDYTFAIDNYGDVTINDGNVTSVHSTVSSYGTVTINGGTFTCNGLEGVTAHALVAWDGSVTNINGGTFDGKDNYNGFNVDSCKGAIVNIYGGNFLPVHSGSLYGEGTINVYSGTFFDNVASRVAEGSRVELEDGLYVVKRADRVVSTLDELLSAMEQDNAYIALTADLVVPASFGANAISYTGDNNLTIDLCGHTITTKTSNSLFRLRNEGTRANEITICNGTLNIEGAWCSVVATGVSAPLTLNLNNLTINESKENSQSIKAFSGSTVNMSDCTVNTTLGGGVTATGGTVNILGDGNKFTQTQVSSWANYCSNNLAVDSNGTLNVYGGTFVSDYYCVEIMSSGGTANIYGGNFTTTHSENRVCDAGTDGVYNAAKANSVLNIYGGSFDNANTAELNDGGLSVWDWTPTDSASTYLNVYAAAKYGSVINHYNGAKVEYFN